MNDTNEWRQDRARKDILQRNQDPVESVMINILAFGDSLTWGSCPRTNGRHPPHQRWPVAMGEQLPGCHIVSEGLRGRTTAFSRPTASAEMSGVLALPMLLHSHAPLDLVIIMLGTNDIYEGYDSPQIRDGIARLVEIIRFHPYRLPETAIPDILLVSPPPVTRGANDDVTPAKVQQAENLAAFIGELARTSNCHFFDAAPITRASPLDGFHLEADDSRALGLALGKIVAPMFNRD